ncbi:hypothetical protein B4U80_14896 [Leptotrombidium deliense]|uniref:FAD linked oxidase N-terminal domain-containing protein n=1 Tax=Leptotrombidium deliense TaxID=299467 RepID=A0A443S4H6_9ACAR|nr:hypothetical protein B4U80_14896 [Leptotrombidium deliense]
MRHFVVLIGLLLLIISLSKADQLQECLAEKGSTADTAKVGDNGYDDANFQWNLRKLRNPLGFILVKSTEDVRIAVECLVKLHLKFRVKCGGNSIEKYSFGDNQTWVIDVMHLNSVEKHF